MTQERAMREKKILQTCTKTIFSAFGAILEKKISSRKKSLWTALAKFFTMLKKNFLSNLGGTFFFPNGVQFPQHPSCKRRRAIDLCAHTRLCPLIDSKHSALEFAYQIVFLLLLFPFLDRFCLLSLCRSQCFDVFCLVMTLIWKFELQMSSKQPKTLKVLNGTV